MKPDPERPELALGVDVLAPEGYGEIVGGGERLADLDAAAPAHQGSQPAAGSLRVVPRSAAVRLGAARRLRHGRRARGRLDLRSRARARDDPVSAYAVQAVSVMESGRLRQAHGSASDSVIEPRESWLSMKVGLISLGCPKNLVDSEVMLGLAREAGHELTQDASRGRRARRQHLRVHRLGQAGVDRRDPRDGAAQEGRRLPAAIVTGCLAERYRDELQAEMPEIDAVLGTGEVPDIVRAIGGAALQGVAAHVLPALAAPPAHLTPMHRRSLARHAAAAPPQALPTYIYDADTPRCLATPRHYAYVKIAEGCDYKCAFCIIPTLRGHYRSRPAASIVQEARALAARGVKELLLISQDTTFYGIDRHERGALARLLRELNAVDGLEWIRLLYLYPDDDRRRHARGDGRVRQGLQVHRPAAAARVESGAEADEAARHAGRRYDRLLDRIRDRVPGRRPADHVHRRVSRRNRRGRRRAARVRQRPRVRPRRRVHLLARGRDLGATPRRRRAGAGQDSAAQPVDEPAEAAGRAGGTAAGSASGRGSWSTARRRITSSS